MLVTFQLHDGRDVAINPTLVKSILPHRAMDGITTIRFGEKDSTDVRGDFATVRDQIEAALA